MKKAYPSNIALWQERVKAFLKVMKKKIAPFGLLTNGGFHGIINGNTCAAKVGRMEFI